MKKLFLTAMAMVAFSAFGFAQLPTVTWTEMEFFPAQSSYIGATWDVYHDSPQPLDVGFMISFGRTISSGTGYVLFSGTSMSTYVATLPSPTFESHRVTLPANSMVKIAAFMNGANVTTDVTPNRAGSLTVQIGTGQFYNVATGAPNTVVFYSK